MKEPIIFMETPRLVLRQWIEDDYEPYIALNKDIDVMEFFPSVLTRDETIAQITRITNHIDQYGFGFFAVERKDNNQFIGFTGLAHVRFESFFTPCIEIGWRLSKINWGQKFATEAAKACLDFSFGDLGLNEIYSFTSILNKRSEKVMQKIGMQKIIEFDHPLIAAGDRLQRHVLYNVSSM